MEERKNNTGLVVLVTVLVMLVLGLAGFIVYDKIFYEPHLVDSIIEENDKVENNKENNGNQGSDNIFTIDNNLFENSIKQALIDNVGKDEKQGISSDLRSVWTEAHKTLRSELKEDKIYAYVVAEIQTYTKENNEYKTSGIAGPLVLMFTKDYNFVEYLQPASGVGYEESLKNIFPEDLLDQAMNVDYRTDFYQDQIKSYLD